VGRARLVTALKAAGYFVFLCVRGVLLWLFLVPSVLVWLVALALWPILRPFGVRVPATPSFFARWATHLLDALLTRITPLPASPWPWQVNVRESRIRTWGDTFDL
jgi:hypothetical protein